MHPDGQSPILCGDHIPDPQDKKDAKLNDATQFADANLVGVNSAVSPNKATDNNANQDTKYKLTTFQRC
jgi:hypothetical protein